MSNFLILNPMYVKKIMEVDMKERLESITTVILMAVVVAVCLYLSIRSW
jgi:hypothetical protein